MDKIWIWIWYVNSINQAKRRCHSTCWLIPDLYTNDLDHKLKLHEFSDEGKIYAEFVTMNAGLGNRAPIIGTPQKKWC